MGALHLMGLHICLIGGSILVSFSLKSPTFMVCSWFLSARSKSVTTLTPHFTIRMTEILWMFALPKCSREGISFRIPRIATSCFLWSWKEFSRLHLAVTHKIPVAIALTLQINLLKVVESAKKGSPLLSSHEIFHWSMNQHFHVCNNKCICVFSVITFF